MLDDLISTISEGQSIRSNCPSCGGTGTFTLSKSDTTVIWNCYKISCNLRGATQSRLTKTELVNRIQSAASDRSGSSYTYEHPPAFSAYFPDAMVRYMSVNNIRSAWESGDVEMYHDVRWDRAVFVSSHRGLAIDAVGRALSRGAKWHRYGSSMLPFICGSSDLAIVVEDAASACAVSKFGTGVALLGTTLTDEAIQVIKGFDRAIIALDKDAGSKAIGMARRLNMYLPTTVKFLEQDLKVNPEGLLR